MYTVRDFLQVLGIPFEKWMLEAVKVANEEGEGADLKAIAEEVKSLPQFRPHYFRKSPIKVHVNLDAEGKDEEYLKENKDAVLATMYGLAHLPTVEHAAVMPDACSAGIICVGGVVAARNAIHPAFHSADVCCSMFMTEVFDADPKDVLDKAQFVTHFGVGAREHPVVLPEWLDQKIFSNPFTKPHLHKARRDFATQGDGNHFLSVGTRKSSGNTCLVTHHGSRGFGASVFKHGLKVAQDFGKRIAPKGMPKQCAWIPFDTKEGQQYWEALQIVREWTYMNHKAIHNMALNGYAFADRFWNEHNFVFKRGDLFYHAKGATPGWLDTYDLTLVPMNMEEPILITRGTEVENGIGFLPHGAGRNMSRTKFKELYPDPKIPEGVDIRSYSGKLDITELPQAYKRAEEVKQQIQKYNLAEVVDEINPYGCIMAGEAL
jgi:RNA-splicing ligase RtcB